MMNVAQFVGLNQPPKYLLTLNRVDRDFFANLIQIWPRPDGFGPPGPQTASQTLIAKARRYFEGQITSYAQQKNIDMGELLRRLHSVIVDNFRVVLVTSTTWDDVSDVFERMNDRGKGLSTLDLLRNYLIAKAPDQQQEAVEEAWNDVYELSDSAARVDAFLRHVWISHRGDVKSRSLYKEIKAVMEDDAQPEALRDAYIFSTNLAADTVLYSGLISAEHPDPEARRHLRAIKLLGASALLPAALAGVSKLATDEDQRTLLRSLVSCFVRFNVVGGGESTELEAGVYAAARDLRAGIALEDVRDHLRPLLRSDADIRSEFQTLTASRSGYQRHILEELERYLTLVAKYGGVPPNLQEETEVGPADSGVLWIEHIYPQSPDSTWGRWQNHDDTVNRLGNVTLIHKKLNAEAKNAVFPVKKGLYADSQLILNDWIAARDGWNLADINARQSILAEHVPLIWARF